MESLCPLLPPDKLNGLSTLAMAHVGDGVFELMVRTRLCLPGGITAARLHRETVSHVRAETQAGYARLLLETLTPEERSVFTRGRNTATNSQPKGATRAEYQLATALEALWGHLYLSGQTARLDELFALLPIGGQP
ncbi:MAG: ribonuclease III [Oscillospiraceae bacterium]|jgi:ribonuclease-3 family protein|nr:ribonuclease III [Oscillospiraceae bacterium]